jgi:endonuclease/exonuclease/phosphatase family metal-dependent hydrolase
MKMKLLKIFFILFLGGWLCSGLCQDHKAQIIRVMTFNIRYNNPDDGVNAWSNRKDLAAGLIRFYEPAIFGVQEALYGQMQDLEERLPDYAWIGVGRDDGDKKGEFSAIFYRKNRFEVEDSGTFWLSETPTIKGSIGWDAACVRIVTWLKATDRLSGSTFFMFNTHFDHRGVIARKKSAELLLAKANKIAADSPLIVTGDFNSTASSAVYKILTNTGDKEADLEYCFKDSKELCKSGAYGPDDTFNGFGRSEKDQRIDYIFVNDVFNVLKYGVLCEHWDGIYPSDHMPVLADLSLP